MGKSCRAIIDLIREKGRGEAAAKRGLLSRNSISKKASNSISAPRQGK